MFTLTLALLLAAAPPEENRRPQTPHPPFPYSVLDVSFVSSAGGVKLAGTLTIPARQGMVPCVILVPGAGAVDRDNTILGHKPFLVVADHLARRGIAALRLDSRGVGGSTGSYAAASGDDLAADLLAALNLLSKRPEIDPERLGLIGHSQGGSVASIAASKATSVKFLVLLAAPGLSDTDLFVQRIGAAGKAKAIPPARVGELQNEFRDARQRLFRGESDPAIHKVFEEVVRLMLPAGVDAPPPAISAAVAQQVAAARTANVGFFLAYDPRSSLSRVRCPVLALNGTKDQNVAAAENLAAITDALKASGNQNVQAIPLADLNHFFQTAKSGSSMEVGQIEETFAPSALEYVARWIQSVAGSTDTASAAKP